MRINITFRHCDQSDELRNYVDTRFQKLKKYIDGPMDVNVVLSVEKFRNTAEVIIAGDGIRAAAKEEQDNMHTAIDLLSDKIERQLKRFRERLHGNKKGAGAAPEDVGAEINDDSGDRVIIMEKMPAKPMPVEEAVIQLQTMGRDILAFNNSETGAINVLYWRKDGTLGLMQP
ncbi:MAG: ribosome-associated translation inhibitor RaiA [Desulfobacteraceae bacterium]|nr:ribosome-associated translation inhibitor RaiA [Desulfobacteraceae bacterium]